MNSCMCFIWCLQGDAGERGPQGFKGPKGEIVSKRRWFETFWFTEKKVSMAHLCVFTQGKIGPKGAPGGAGPKGEPVSAFMQNYAHLI